MKNFVLIFLALLLIWMPFCQVSATEVTDPTDLPAEMQTEPSIDPDTGDRPFMTTPLNDYTVTEGFLLLIFVLVLLLLLLKLLGR